MPVVRAITFDVGGTLLEPWPSVGHVYVAVAREFGVNGLSPEELNARFRRAWRARAAFDYSRPGWHALVRETFAERAVELPDAYFSAVYDRFAEPAAWRVFDDVLPTLTRLRQRGLRLGIISNWDERLRPLLRGLGLADWFASIVVSCEAGVTKPDARLFHRAAAELGVAPAELLHVGDDAERDLAGARAAGCQAVLVGREAGAGHGLESLWSGTEPGDGSRKN
jgi:putative hydrolase of the HAD superfamily